MESNLEDEEDFASNRLFMSLRSYIQMVCIEKFKYEESERAGRDIGEYQALIQWIDKGYAESFAKAYCLDRHFLEIYEETILLAENANQD